MRTLTTVMLNRAGSLDSRITVSLNRQVEEARRRQVEQARAAEAAGKVKKGSTY